jgi:hypothetical protein
MQVDGPASGEQDPDDPTDISKMFYQYMYEWGHMPPQQYGSVATAYTLSSVSGSELSSHPGEFGWEGRGMP